MREINKLMQDKAAELLASGTVDRVLAWRSGEFFYDNAPTFFSKAEECAEIVYDDETTGLGIGVNRSSAEKCPRCWKRRPEVAEKGLCDRCRDVLNAQ